MGCTSAFPLPLIQMNIKAYMRKMIEPKIETKFVKTRQKYFKVNKTSIGQKHQAQDKISKVQVENKITQVRLA